MWNLVTADYLLQFHGLPAERGTKAHQTGDRRLPKRGGPDTDQLRLQKSRHLPSNRLSQPRVVRVRLRHGNACRCGQKRPESKCEEIASFTRNFLHVVFSDVWFLPTKQTYFNAFKF